MDKDSNSIVIMTSNIGSRQLKDFGQGVGFNTGAKKSTKIDYARGVIENALKKAFAPEFLNRIDDVVIFDPLERDDIHKIIDIELNYLYNRVKGLGYLMEVTEKAKDFIVDKGWDEQFGARPLKRAIQKYIEDPLAEEIIKTKLAEGDKILVDHKVEESELIIELVKLKKEVVKSK